MIIILKNMEGWKHKDLKSKEFDSIKELFDKAFKRVNMFMDFRTDLVEGSSKRAGEELEQESTKKQKVDDDKEIVELKQCWKSFQCKKRSKEKSERDRGRGVGRRKRDVRGESIWINKTSGRLRFSVMDLQSGMIYMLVEKRYPLTPPIITDMLNKKLQYKVNAAEGVNVASEEVSTPELVSIAYEYVQVEDYLKHPLALCVVGSMIVILHALQERDTWKEKDCRPGSLGTMRPMANNVAGSA
ncbi:hypothetical protein Tco_0103917 [Tanacetum coccineum]